MRRKTMLFIVLATILALMGPATGAAAAEGPEGAIVHDAEYYILEAQNGQKWAAQDKALDERLAELRKKFGKPPNIIHVMWDDTSYGDVGIPAINKIRGFETPNMNRMAEEGIMFTRMYTEVGCTPSRAAVASALFGPAHCSPPLAWAWSPTSLGPVPGSPICFPAPAPLPG